MASSSRVTRSQRRHVTYREDSQSEDEVPLSPPPISQPPPPPALALTITYEGRSIIVERSIEIAGQLGEYCNRFGWHKLMGHAPKACHHLTREFYMALRPAVLKRGETPPDERRSKKPYKLSIRGKKVKISEKIINNHYDLLQDGKLPYKHYTDEYDTTEWTPEAIGVALGLDGVQTLIPKTGNYTYKQFSPLAKAWVYFLCSRLIPVRHITELTSDRAKATYALMNDYGINPGRVILQEMETCARQVRQQLSLPFAGLITELCQATGVPTEAGDTWQKPPGPILLSTFSRDKPEREIPQQDHPEAPQREDSDEMQFFHRIPRVQGVDAQFHVVHRRLDLIHETVETIQRDVARMYRLLLQQVRDRSATPSQEGSASPSHGSSSNGLASSSH